MSGETRAGIPTCQGLVAGQTQGNQHNIKIHAVPALDSPSYAPSCLVGHQHKKRRNHVNLHFSSLLLDGLGIYNPPLRPNTTRTPLHLATPWEKLQTRITFASKGLSFDTRTDKMALSTNGRGNGANANVAQRSVPSTGTSLDPTTSLCQHLS
jgi:hypothetical protein